MTCLRTWTPGLVVSTDVGNLGERPVEAARIRRVAHGLPCGPRMMGSGRATDEEEFTRLFAAGMDDWEMTGSGRFVVVDGRLESVPGDDVGLCWCTVPTPPDFVLRLSWLRWRHEDTSAVVLRFPRPQPSETVNPAWVATTRGYAVRIDEVGIPGSTSIHMTGAIFNEPAQRITPRAARAAAEWNDFEITVRGNHYEVALNGLVVTTFVNTDPRRGLPSAPGAPAFIGVQVAPGSRVAFRDIRMKPL